MGTFDNILARGRKAKTFLLKRQVAEAGVAFLTLVGYADGSMDEEEYASMEEIYEADPVMKAFPFATLNAKHTELAKQFNIGKMLGQRACLKELRDIREEEADARDRIVLLAMALADKGGGTSDAEKDALRKGIKELGLVPADYDL